MSEARDLGEISVAEILGYSFECPFEIFCLLIEPLMNLAYNSA